MHAFAAAWNGAEPIIQTPSGQLSWGRSVTLLNKADDQEVRTLSAVQAAHHWWSVAVLEYQVLTDIHARVVTAPRNLEAQARRVWQQYSVVRQ
ncbi:DUF1016 N-terminal domain-containing protein [Arthrobacter sp. Ld5]|uniref:DUF1016 N-terminal domain-containing protein n=1 Tax=Arthrobacter sp. Ld5 TaxID=649152 RepID=UPI003EBC3412